MRYSGEDLEKLYEGYLGLEGRCGDVMSSYLNTEFTNNNAQEFVNHGFCRRLELMTRCIVNVFELLPPECQQVPDSHVRQDVTVNLQAFIFNTHGCLDNLAHIWVLEKNVRKANGKKLPLIHVGFGKKNKTVRKSLPKKFLEYLSNIQVWQNNLENFRHALAHRIPVYIPPGILIGERVEKYREIEERINEAVRQRDSQATDQLRCEQNALLSFDPVATHSFGENAPIVLFHAQMLNDIETVQQAALLLLPEFNE